MSAVGYAAMKRRVALLLIAGLIAACHGPLGPIPGGRLSGPVMHEPVGDWSFAERYRVAEVETNPSDPHAVAVNYFVADGRLYLDIGTDAEAGGWSQYIRDDPRVRVRFGETVYELIAVPVTDGDEFALLLPVFYAKSSERPPPGCVAPFTENPCPRMNVRFVRLAWRPY